MPGADRTAPAAVPLIPSCNARLHIPGRIDVVRWRNRYQPCKRKFPTDLKLGILSRARTRVQLRDVAWLIHRAKRKSTDRTDWIWRVPRKFLNSYVDLTVELFQQRDLVTATEMDTIFAEYLRLRHAREKKPLCENGFFIHYFRNAAPLGKAYVERYFGLLRRRLNLNQLYRQGGLSRPDRTRRCTGRTPDETPDSFTLLCYVTLPNSFERDLKPPPPPPPSRKEIIKKMNRGLSKLRKSPLIRKRFENKHSRAEIICLITLALRHFRDGVDVTDIYLDGIPKFLMDQIEQAWRASRDNEAVFLTKLKTLHGRVFAALRVIVARAERIQADAPRSSWSKNADYLLLCDVYRRSAKPLDIFHCFRNYLHAHVIDKSERHACPP